VLNALRRFGPGEKIGVFARPLYAEITSVNCVSGFGLANLLTQVVTISGAGAHHDAYLVRK
jgi:hypothetical protein